MRAISDSLDEAIASTCRHLGFEALKPQQYKVIRNFMEGEDVLLYTTEFGNHLCLVFYHWPSTCTERRQPIQSLLSFSGKLEDDTGTTERVIVPSLQSN